MLLQTFSSKFFFTFGQCYTKFFFFKLKSSTHTRTQLKLLCRIKLLETTHIGANAFASSYPGSPSPLAPLSLSPPSSLRIPNSMIHTLALWRVDRVSNNLSEVWIPVGNHFMWSFRVQVASHPFLFTKTAQVNKLGAIFNLNNCREIHQLKRVTPHEFTYITVDKQAHEICK